MSTGLINSANQLFRLIVVQKWTAKNWSNCQVIESNIGISSLLVFFVQFSSITQLWQTAVLTYGFQVQYQRERHGEQEGRESKIISRGFIIICSHRPENYTLIKAFIFACKAKWIHYKDNTSDIICGRYKTLRIYYKQNYRRLRMEFLRWQMKALFHGYGLCSLYY